MNRFRALAQRLEVVVFFALRARASDQAKAGFGVGFDWDVDLFSGYTYGHLEKFLSPNRCESDSLTARGGASEAWSRRAFLILSAG
jgi:hypothetical protein